MASPTDKPVFTRDQLVSSSKLSKNLGAFLKESRRRPIAILRGSDIEAVLISYEQYAALIEEVGRAEELFVTALAVRRMTEMALQRQAAIPLAEVIARYGVEEPLGLADDPDEDGR